MGSDDTEIWKKVIEKISTHVNKQTYDMWFKDARALYFDGTRIIIQVQDDVAKRHLIENYTELFNTFFMEIVGKQVIIDFIVGADENPVDSGNKEVISSFIVEKDIPAKPNTGYSYLNPKYVFDTFIVGPNNQLAYATAISISKAPAKQYNPFFIYGESGLGKTHLLQAIGNAIAKDQPYLKVLYTSIEQYMNEFVQSIQNNTQQSFKIKYRNVDILLIDDIQFIQKKEGTQDEFFYTFEDLYKSNKQIVMTSDKPPKDFSLLADRLRTRFEWGLLADITPPNIETREAILRKKAEIEGISIADDVIIYLAKRIKTNIRKLESSLTTLYAISSVSMEPISVQMAKQHLKFHFDEEVSKQITIYDIMQKVADRLNVTVEDLQSKSRHSSIIQPRFISMYISTRLTNMTTIEIGKEFGNRDHSTVINARNNIQKNMEEDPILKEMIEDIISELKS